MKYAGFGHVGFLFILDYKAFSSIAISFTLVSEFLLSSLKGLILDFNEF
jgi:hypothetical protein